MRKAVPRITDSAADLKQRLQREHDGRKKPRLQMLYLLASAHAATRQDGAHMLGVSRNTVGRCLALDETGGTPALRAIPTPLGNPPALAPDLLASIEQALRKPTGFGSSEALRQWVERTHHVRVKDKPRSTIVRKRCKPKLKVPRLSHTNKA